MTFVRIGINRFIAADHIFEIERLDDGTVAFTTIHGVKCEVRGVDAEFLWRHLTTRSNTGQHDLLE